MVNRPIPQRVFVVKLAVTLIPNPINWIRGLLVTFCGSCAVSRRPTHRHCHPCGSGKALWRATRSSGCRVQMLKSPPITRFYEFSLRAGVGCHTGYHRTPFLTHRRRGSGGVSEPQLRLQNNALVGSLLHFTPRCNSLQQHLHRLGPHGNGRLRNGSNGWTKALVPGEVVEANDANVVRTPQSNAI